MKKIKIFSVNVIIICVRSHKKICNEFNFIQSELSLKIQPLNYVIMFINDLG